MSAEGLIGSGAIRAARMLNGPFPNAYLVQISQTISTAAIWILAPGQSPGFLMFVAASGRFPYGYDVEPD